MQTIGELAVNLTELSWQPPVQPGATSILYDVLRTDSASEFVEAECVLSGSTATMVADGLLPTPGRVLFYVVRVENGCGSTMGLATDLKPPREGPDCP